MNEVILLILVIGGYSLGVFITKIIITIYDHAADPLFRFGDNGLIMVLFWPMVLPLFLLICLFSILCQAGENIGDSIWKRLKRW